MSEAAGLVGSAVFCFALLLFNRPLEVFANHHRALSLVNSRAPMGVTQKGCGTLPTMMLSQWFSHPPKNTHKQALSSSAPTA